MLFNPGLNKPTYEVIFSRKLARQTFTREYLDVKLNFDCHLKEKIK